MPRKTIDNYFESLLMKLPWWTMLVVGGITAIMTEVRPLKLPIFLVFAGVSGLIYLVQQKSRRLLDQQVDLESIRALSWQKFEQLVGEAYRHQGYFVIENTSDGADGGIDLELRNLQERVIVQCKQWRVIKVGVKPVRELYGVLMHEQASRAIFVTSGSYTAEALSFAHGKPLLLIDGEQLLALIGKVREDNDPQPNTIAHVRRRQQTEPRTDNDVPACPTCGSLMILRTAKRGTYAGEEFWGCSNYPVCLGKRKI